MQKGVIMAPFCTFSEGKNSLTRKKQSYLFLYRTVNQLFTGKSVISNQLINYKTTAIVLSRYYHLAILDIDTLEPEPALDFS